MPQKNRARAIASQIVTSGDNVSVSRHVLRSPSYSVLEACDTLALTRCSETYLESLEHYLYASSIPSDSRDQILMLLRLYRNETAAGLDRTASILKEALDAC